MPSRPPPILVSYAESAATLSRRSPAHPPPPRRRAAAAPPREFGRDALRTRRAVRFIRDNHHLPLSPANMAAAAESGGGCSAWCSFCRWRRCSRRRGAQPGGAWAAGHLRAADVAMIAFWWGDWPGSLLPDLSATALAAAGGAALTLLGRTAGGAALHADAAGHAGRRGVGRGVRWPGVAALAVCWVAGWALYREPGLVPGRGLRAGRGADGLVRGATRLAVRSDPDGAHRGRRLRPGGLVRANAGVDRAGRGARSSPRCLSWRCCGSSPWWLARPYALTGWSPHTTLNASARR